MTDELHPKLEAEIGADAGELYRVLKDVQAQLAKLAGEDATVDIKGDASGVLSAIAAAEAQLKAFTKSDPTVKLHMDSSPAEATLAAFRGMMDAAQLKFELAGIQATLAETIAARDPLATELLFGTPKLPSDLQAFQDAQKKPEGTWLERFGLNRLFQGLLGTQATAEGSLFAGIAPSLAILGSPLVLGPIIGLAGGLFDAAAGFTALAAAAGPAAVAIGQGYSAINSAQDAVNNAIPGTTTWTQAVQGLGAAWMAIDPNLQPAVQAILSLSSSSGIFQQAQNWLVNTVEQVTGFLGGRSGASVFQPLVSSAEQSVTTMIGYIEKAMSNPQGGLRKFIDGIAKDLWPTLQMLGHIFLDIGRVFTALGSAMGGQKEGLALLTNVFNLIAELAHSSLVIGFLHGFITFDRVVLGLVTHLLQLLTIVGHIVNLPGLGSIAGYAVSAFLTLSVVQGLMGRILRSKTMGNLFGTGGAGAEAAVGADATAVAEAAAGGAVATDAAQAAKGWIPRLAKLIGGGVSGAADAAGIGVSTMIAAFTLPVLLDEIASSIWGHGKGYTPFHAGPKGILPPNIPLRFGGGATPGFASPQIAGAAQHQATALQAAASAALQYQLALNGVLPPTGKATAATNALIVSEEGITSAFSSQATGVTAYTVQTSFSVEKMINNMYQRNHDLSTWAGDAQQLLKRGADPKFIDMLANTAPQELGVMMHATKSQLARMGVQWQEQIDIASMASYKNLGLWMQSIKNQLTSQSPTIRAAAQQLANAMGIPINNIIANWTTTLGAALASMRRQLIAAAPSLGVGAINAAAGVAGASSGMPPGHHAAGAAIHLTTVVNIGGRQLAAVTTQQQLVSARSTGNVLGRYAGSNQVGHGISR